MNRQNQLLRRISISKRIVILILLVSVLPILLVGSFGYLQARSAIYRTAADYNQKLVDIIKQNITLRLQEFVNLSDELILNTTVRNALESYEDMNSTQKYWTVQNIYSEVRSKYTRIADICDHTHRNCKQSSYLQHGLPVSELRAGSAELSEDLPEQGASAVVHDPV